MARTDRVARLMQLLRVLPQPVTADRLARELGVSKRTLYRDVDSLRAAGAVIDGAAGVGYTLVEDGAMPPQILDRLEVEAVILGLAALERFGDAALARAGREAGAKIVASLPVRRQREALHAVLMTHGFGARAEPRVSLEALRRACWEERAVRIDYVDKSGRRTARTVEPLSLVYLEETLALLAYCTLRRDYRTFLVERIETLAPTDASFRPRRVPMLRDYVARLRGG